MARKPKYMQVGRDQAVAYLNDITSSGQRLTTEHWETAQEMSGYSRKQLRRLTRMDDPATQCSGPFTVDEGVVTALFLTAGNISAAHRSLVRDGGRDDLPCRRQFARAIVAQVDTHTLTYARKGSSGARNVKIYLQTEVVPRNHTWELDHTELPIWVIPQGTKTPVRPWLTVVLDRSTRYPLAWVVTFGRPSAQEVSAVLAQAITLRAAPDGETPVGGKPLRCLWDRGLEFLSQSVTEACLSLGIMPVPLPAYSPHLKPHIERFWRFLKEDLLPPLPGYTDKIADLRGTSAIASSCLEEDEFLLKLADWIDWYIQEHVHSTLRCTPLEAWKAQANEPMTEVDVSRLWEFYLTHHKEVKISKNGIRFDTIDFAAAELTGYVGRSVTIRYLPNDRTFIEVFIDGEHLCTAYPRAHLTEDQQQAIIHNRQQIQAASRARFSTANRLRRQAHSSTTPIARNSKGKMAVVERPSEDSLDLMADAEEAYNRISSAGEVYGQGTLL